MIPKGEEVANMDAIVASLVLLGVIAGPTFARVIADRRAERAAAVAADVRAAVRRRLGGESLVSVAVRADGVWAPGRVMLSAPSGCSALIEAVWPAVVACLPARYELVVSGAVLRPQRVAPAAAPLSRAA